MNRTAHETAAQDEFGLQELDLQEMEAIESPGWATSIVISVGVTAASLAWSIT